MEAVINAVSRNIDDVTNRFFYADGTTLAPVARYYTARAYDRIYIDDFTSIASIATDTSRDLSYTTTFTTGQYTVEPINNPRQGRPYSSIQLMSSYFSLSPQGVKVTGVWGWSAVPDVVRQACLIQCLRIFLRPSTPFGIAGNTDMGMVRLLARLDGDVQVMLEKLIRVNGQIN